ncbi:MAG: sugar transferase [Patescibacteria group bacterium]
MNQNREVWKNAITILVDFAMVVFGAGLVYLIRYKRIGTNLNFDGEKVIFGKDYLLYSLLFALITVIVFSILRIYSLRDRFSWWNLSLRFFFGIGVTTSMLITFLYFNQYNTSIFQAGVPIGRFIIGAGFFVIFYCICFGRVLIYAAEFVLHLMGHLKENVAVIGGNETPELKEEIIRSLESSSQIGEIYKFNKLSEMQLELIEKIIKTHGLSQIILLDKNTFDEIELKLVSMCEKYKLRFLFKPSIADIYNIYSTNESRIENELFLELKYSKLDGWWVVLKRLFDILFALSFILLFSWVYIIIAIALLIQNESDVFYLSERVGPDGKVFKMWKFARMKREFSTSEKNEAALKLEAELIAKSNMKAGDGPLYKIKDDPRNTKVGAFLEKTSLDELPQFFNVLIGNMSVVGPRPHQPREVAKYRPNDYKVLNIKPGVSGMAQINGRSDLTFDQEVELDTYYVENWSFLLDLYVIVQTPLVIIFRRHKS